MRFFYFFLWFTLKYTLRIYFRTVKNINGPKEFFGRTIYVSNHAASFMDPLVVATFRRPIVFFMTRSDVFNKYVNPILWSAHMLPIYRQHDGEDTKAKNAEIFKKCVKILSFGRNLLIFGEGFTDDTFIRRLKPVKKGAARIGFQTLEDLNWSKKVYIAAVGCNYTEPNRLRSDFLVKTSEKICLNDYKEAYLANPSKTITDLTKEIEARMQACITHVERAELAPAHENFQQLTRKGMHPVSFDERNLKKRFDYSQQLAQLINRGKEEQQQNLLNWSAKVDAYNAKREQAKLTEREVKEQKVITSTANLVAFFGLTPMALLGVIHTYLPYLFIKKWVEKSFKRKVFWGSVKMLLGMFIFGLVNLPVPFLFEAFIFPSFALGWLYYGCIGIFFYAFILWKKQFAEMQRKANIQIDQLKALGEERAELLKEAFDIFPEAKHLS